MLGEEDGTLPLGRAFRYTEAKFGTVLTSWEFNNFLASVDDEKEAKMNRNMKKMDVEILE